MSLKKSKINSKINYYAVMLTVGLCVPTFLPIIFTKDKMALTGAFILLILISIYSFLVFKLMFSQELASDKVFEILIELMTNNIQEFEKRINNTKPAMIVSFINSLHKNNIPENVKDILNRALIKDNIILEPSEFDDNFFALVDGKANDVSEKFFLKNKGRTTDNYSSPVKLHAGFIFIEHWEYDEPYIIKIDNIKEVKTESRKSIMSGERWFLTILFTRSQGFNDKIRIYSENVQQWIDVLKENGDNIKFI